MVLRGNREFPTYFTVWTLLKPFIHSLVALCSMCFSSFIKQYRTSTMNKLIAWNFLISYQYFFSPQTAIIYTLSPPTNLHPFEQHSTLYLLVIVLFTHWKQLIVSSFTTLFRLSFIQCLLLFLYIFFACSFNYIVIIIFFLLFSCYCWLSVRWRKKRNNQINGKLIFPTTFRVAYILSLSSIFIEVLTSMDT